MLEFVQCMQLIKKKYFITIDDTVKCSWEALYVWANFKYLKCKSFQEIILHILISYYN